MLIDLELGLSLAITEEDGATTVSRLGVLLYDKRDGSILNLDDARPVYVYLGVELQACLRILN